MWKCGCSWNRKMVSLQVEQSKVGGVIGARSCGALKTR